MSIFRVGAAIVCLALALPLGAFVPKQEGSHDLLQLDPPRIAVRAAEVDPDEPTLAGSSARSFLARHGGAWSFRLDSRTSRFSMIQGSGIPLIPGRGNDLGTAALAGLDLPDGEITLGALEPRIRSFLEANGSLLLPDRGSLVLDGESSQLREDGRLISFNFDWHVDGVPVEGAAVFVRINSGNITQAGAPLVGPIDLDTRPLVEAREAVDLLLDYTGDREVAQLQGMAELVIRPEEDGVGGGGGINHRLLWKITYRIRDRIETWEGRIDAHTGELVSFRDTNAYARAVGGVYPRTVYYDDETTVAIPYLDVTVGGLPATGDTAGFFGYGGGEVASGLNGQFIDTNCEGCSNPVQPSVATSGVGTGRIDFGLGGDDEIGNGFSSAADRNSFYQLNQIRRMALKWLPGLGFLNQTHFTSNVNISSTCNAVYTGDAVNFYRSGGGCNNTGEIADVMYHEYGHGIDQNTNGGDGATGEGTADAVSMQLTKSPEVGPGFRTTGEPVRNLDWRTNSIGLLTVGNALGPDKCGPCTAGQSCGPLGAEVHCEGEIYGQVAWDVAQALTAKHGYHTGWRTSERVFFTSLPDANGYLPTDSQPVYDAYISADDDNGNLADGTPNAGEIFNAFDRHEMANAPLPSSPGCPRPTQPTLSVTPQCDRFDLSWSAVGGVDHYEVFRAEVLEDMGLFPVATVAAGQTTYSDLEVAPGVDYWYVVMAVDAAGCESTVDDLVSAELPPQAILSLVTAVADDTPAGNQSGYPDPGEDVDLHLTLGNFGQSDATLLAGTLTSATPGVTILLDTSDYDDLAPGESGENLDALRFRTDDLVVFCGDALDFQFMPSGSSGCASDTSFFNIILGELVAEVADDFETDQGWQHDAVNSTAATGTWTLGDPGPTTYQPGDDVTETGSQCWFTAPNPGGANGTDDVDDGVVILLSPTFDLSALDEAQVSYYRWFAMSQPGSDSGDFFKADVSADDGANWVNLETLDSNQPAPAWTKRSFKLQDFIALTSQVRFRFQAADGAPDGSIVEAAIDEFAISRNVCDDTPACLEEPTFDGLEAAVAGSSCGEIDLTWQPAVSNCVDGVISYNVYRSTQSGFAPGPENRVMSGLGGVSVTDTLLDPGQTYYYIVRARDSRSTEDGNLVEIGAVPPAGPDISAPLFDGVESVVSGGFCGETVLVWSEALESCNTPVAYDVFRSTDPAFTPGPANLVATTFGTGFVDAGLPPGVDHTYVVRARDAAGNADTNDVHLTANATALDATIFETHFEPNNAGWSVTAPNDATDGNWQWGNPVGTAYQPENDATPDGVNCWITGLAAGTSNGDVDGGTTTLLSARYSMATAVNPVVQYTRWFTNDQGGSPGDPTDTFRIEVSNDGGGNWTMLEEIGAGTPLQWIPVEVPIPLAPSADMQFRFTAADLGAGSLVEAGIDDFALIDEGQGCSGSACAFTPPNICAIHVGRSGDDIVVAWTTDPGRRAMVYAVSGCDEAILIGTVDGGTSFVHEGAALASESFSYRITTVDNCGEEMPFCGDTDCP
jgi:hypothetical protein